MTEEIKKKKTIRWGCNEQTKSIGDRCENGQTLNGTIGTIMLFTHKNFHMTHEFFNK